MQQIQLVVGDTPAADFEVFLPQVLLVVLSSRIASSRPIIGVAAICFCLVLSFDKKQLCF